jgi:hypothetical protein
MAANCKSGIRNSSRCDGVFSRSKGGWDNDFYERPGIRIGDLQISAQFLYPLLHSSDSDAYPVGSKLHDLVRNALAISSNRPRSDINPGRERSVDGAFISYLDQLSSLLDGQAASHVNVAINSIKHGVFSFAIGTIGGMHLRMS